MDIGNKFYYDKITSKIVSIIPERSGCVIETTLEDDLIAHPELHQYPKEDIGFIQLAYGERRDEIINAGKMWVENGELKTAPRPVLIATKTKIQADGVDFTTITADVADYFSINGEGQYFVNPLEFSSQLIGIYIITAHSETNGNNSIMIEVI